MQYTLAARGTLCLLKPSSKELEPALASGAALPTVRSNGIPDLPNEIWIKIFEYVNLDTKWKPCKYYWDWGVVHQNSPSLLLLMLVCQKFRELGEPIFYQRITIMFNRRRGFVSRERFLKTVQSRPTLCQHIKKLQLVFDGRNSSLYEQAERMDNEEKEVGLALAFLSRVKPDKLVLGGNWESKLDQGLCLALARIEVRALLVRSSFGQFVFHYLRWGRSSALRKLRLCSASASGTWHQPVQYLSLAEKVPAIDQEFSIGIDTFDSSGGDMSAEELYHICRFITSLKIFKLDWVVHHMNDRTYTRDSLQKILDLHQTTLQEIRLPIYFSKCTNLLTFTPFSSLKRLFLSWDNLAGDTPPIAAQKLHAPILQYLSIDMDHGDQQCRGLGSFGDSETKWLTEFTRCRKPSSCLKHYHIILEWIDYCDYVPYYGGEAENYPWPNIGLKLFKPDLAELGVELSWNEPLLSEEQWTEQLQEQIQLSRQYAEGVPLSMVPASS